MEFVPESKIGLWFLLAVPLVIFPGILLQNLAVFSMELSFSLLFLVVVTLFVGFSTRNSFKGWCFRIHRSRLILFEKMFVSS